MILFCQRLILRLFECTAPIWDSSCPRITNCSFSRVGPFFSRIIPVRIQDEPLQLEHEYLGNLSKL